MVYSALPRLVDIISDDPLFNTAITETQDHSNEFYENVTEAARSIQDTVVTGKQFNRSIKSLSSALETSAALLPDHTTSLEKFSTGLARIETYREMLITQTEVLTLEPLVALRKEMKELKGTSFMMEKADSFLLHQTDRYCAIKPPTQDEHSVASYPRSCIETLKLKEEHALEKLEYVRKLRQNTRSNQLKFVQKMLEQMLAQYSYANFAYVVMSEMEPYLSDLFVELQNIEKKNAEQSLEDEKVTNKTRQLIKDVYTEQIHVMKDTYPDSADSGSWNNPIRSLLSFAVPAKGGKLDYLSSKRDSFFSYINNENASLDYNNRTEDTQSDPTSCDQTPSDEAAGHEGILHETSGPKVRENPFNRSPVKDPVPCDEPNMKNTPVLPAVEDEYLNLASTDGWENVTIRGSQSASDLRSLSDENELDVVEVHKRSVSDAELLDNDRLNLELDAKPRRNSTKSPRKINRKTKLVRISDRMKPTEKTRCTKNKTSGYLYVREKTGLGRKWVLKYCVIQDDWLKCIAADNEQIELEHLPTTTVKPAGAEVERCSCFYAVSPQGKKCYQALSELDRKEWMGSLTQSSINALQRSRSVSQGSHLNRIFSISGNDACADCGAASPEWACIDHSTTICIDCSGVHRSLGVNVSKVRSLLLDNWSEQLIRTMEGKGNTVFNEIYEWELQQTGTSDREDRISECSTREERNVFIKKKYIEKLYHQPNAKVELDSNSDSRTPL